jgi:hypothetical protein
MIEIRACAADFVRLVAAENAPNCGFGLFAARLIRGNQIRGHDENAPIVDEQTDVADHFGRGPRYQCRGNASRN